MRPLRDKRAGKIFGKRFVQEVVCVFVANFSKVCQNGSREITGGCYGQSLCIDGQKRNRKGYGV